MTKGTEFSNNEPCGCESGLPYGECCKHEKATYVRDKRGAVFRQVVLSQEAVEALEGAKHSFSKTFGRQPGRGDKVFANSAFRHSPADFDREVEKTILEAGIRKELIYARRKTEGLILTRETFGMASPADRETWTNAISEYRESLEVGIDLLRDNGPVAQSLDHFSEFLDDAVVHLGSYADRAPKRVGRNLPLFFQFLLLARCHQNLKTLADVWQQRTLSAIFPVLRTIYECTLLIERVEVEPGYADTLLAQTLAGSELYPFRELKRGGLDYSTLIDARTGEHRKARNSFYECAKRIGEGAAAFFDVIYPELSSKVHFHSLDLLQRYRDTGSFVMWEESKAEDCSIVATIVLSYLASCVSALSNCPRPIRKDASFLHKRAIEAMGGCVCALDDEDRDVEPTIMVLSFAAMNNFRLPETDL